jgi:hypothetical protein
MEVAWESSLQPSLLVSFKVTFARGVHNLKASRNKVAQIYSDEMMVPEKISPSKAR